MATDDKNKIHDFIAFHVVSKSYSKNFFAFEKMGASKKSRKKMFVNFLKGRNKGSLASLEVASRGS